MTNHTIKPTIGLIVPPLGGGVPPECSVLYGERVSFQALSAELATLDIAGYQEAERRLPSLARQLADNGCQAIVLMGTSLSFYGGYAHVREIEQRMADAAGVPTTSMSSAVIAALHAVGARRVAVASAYVDEVNRALLAFLNAFGLECTALHALDIRDVRTVHEVTEDTLFDLGMDAIASGDGADTLFISCGGLRTLGLTDKLERKIQRPAISSAVAGAWAAASLAGVSVRKNGYGTLLEADVSFAAERAAQPKPN